jgi:hypothetical protein
MHRRSMIVLFTDMFQTQIEEALFNALQHLKHNKHKVVLFHVILMKKPSCNFDFDNAPRKFIDVETGEEVNFLPKMSKKRMKKTVQKDTSKNRIDLCIRTN